MTSQLVQRADGLETLLPAFLVAFALVASPLFAQTVVDGQTSSGAYYRIAVPDGWSPADGLVLWNHGYSQTAPSPFPDLGPLVAVQLSEGYAVAASSYSLSGWALFRTERDNRELVEVFEQQFGVPSQVLLAGASLGGLVTAQGVEQRDLGNVVGALPICGALSGSRIWDAALDLRLLYDYVCAGVPGAQIPGAAEGLPYPVDPGVTEVTIAAAITACTGVLLPENLRSAGQVARLDRLLDLTGLPESFLPTDMGYATVALSDLIHDPLKLDGASAIGNAEVDYGDAGANAGIERVDVEPLARGLLRDNFTPSGKVGSTKIVSLHTDKDGLVLLENEAAYAERVPSENLTVGVVVEDQPSHCGFSEAEILAGWESLRAWVADLPQPSTATLQAACQGLEAGGLASGPCRFDAGVVLPDVDGRLRPRASCDADADTLCLNDGRFRVEVEWKDSLGGSGVGKEVLSSEDSGLLYFFKPANWEMLVKVLDGCSFNNRYWVFSAATTNVEYTLRVTDTESGLVRQYHNLAGAPAPATTDTQAFATCP